MLTRIRKVLSLEPCHILGFHHTLHFFPKPLPLKPSMHSSLVEFRNLVFNNTTVVQSLNKTQGRNFLQPLYGFSMHWTLEHPLWGRVWGFGEKAVLVFRSQQGGNWHRPGESKRSFDFEGGEEQIEKHHGHENLKRFRPIGKELQWV